MKYTKSTIITDEDGDLLFEESEEVTADEIRLMKIASPEPINVMGVAIDAPSEKKGGYPCKNCGVPGHRAKTCQKKEGTPSSFREGIQKAAEKPTAAAPEPSVAPIPGCNECKSKGWKHKNWCSKGTPEYKGESKTEALSEEQFDLVKDARENDHHFSSLKCSDELGLDMKEVNRAVLTRNYEAYMTSYNAST